MGTDQPGWGGFSGARLRGSQPHRVGSDSATAPGQNPALRNPFSSVPAGGSIL